MVFSVRSKDGPFRLGEAPLRSLNRQTKTDAAAQTIAPTNRQGITSPFGQEAMGRELMGNVVQQRIAKSRAETPQLRFGSSFVLGGTSGGGDTSGSVKDRVWRQLDAEGMGDQRDDVIKLMAKENSSWNPTARGPWPDKKGNLAFGLFQFMLPMHGGPGGYLPSGTNASIEEQTRGFARYIRDRYGGRVSNALAHHARKNWY